LISSDLLGQGSDKNKLSRAEPENGRETFYNILRHEHTFLLEIFWKLMSLDHVLSDFFFLASLNKVEIKYLSHEMLYHRQTAAEYW